MKTSYFDLINDVDSVKDNAGLMAIKYMINCGVKNIFLAGFDGYSYNFEQNYGLENMTIITKKKIIDEMNQGMKKVLTSYKKMIKIIFLTEEKYI